MNRKTKAEALEDIKSLQEVYTSSVIEALKRGFNPDVLAYIQETKAELDFLLKIYPEE